MRGLEPSPKDRYHSAEQFGIAIARAAFDAFGPDWLERSGVKLLALGPILHAAEGRLRASDEDDTGRTRRVRLASNAQAAEQANDWTAQGRTDQTSDSAAPLDATARREISLLAAASGPAIHEGQNASPATQSKSEPEDDAREPTISKSQPQPERVASPPEEPWSSSVIYDAGRSRSQSRFRSRWRWWVAAAAAVLLVGGIGVYALLRLGSSSGNSEGISRGSASSATG